MRRYYTEWKREQARQYRYADEALGSASVAVALLCCLPPFFFVISVVLMILLLASFLEQPPLLLARIFDHDSGWTLVRIYSFIIFSAQAQKNMPSQLHPKNEK